jgi:hypothetical protein
MRLQQQLLLGWCPFLQQQLLLLLLLQVLLGRCLQLQQAGGRLLGVRRQGLRETQ